MIIKFLSLLTIFTLACGCSLIIVFCFWGSCCFLESALYSIKRIKISIAAMNKFERFAQLYYTALNYIPDPFNIVRNKLKRQWEDELCQK